jgi:hypothetical protein
MGKRKLDAELAQAWYLPVANVHVSITNIMLVAYNERLLAQLA